MTSAGTFDVYVANIPFGYNEEQIREIFDVAGEISGVKIVPPKDDGKGKIAFVKFVNEEDAKCAAQYMSNHQLDDKTHLTVRYNATVQTEKTVEAISNGNHVNGVSQAKSPNKTVKYQVDEMFPVYVVHVESPIQFWAQKFTLTHAAEIQEITEQMEKQCPAQPKVVGQLSTQQIYGCKFSEDGLWYRCCVERCLTKNMVHVRYIDYGNSETVERFGLVSLPLNLTTKPPSASCFRLDGLELTVSDENSELFKKGVQTVTELIHDQTIEVKVVRTENTVNVTKVCRIQNGSLLDLATKLIANGCAKVKIDKPAPFSMPPKSNQRIRSPFSIATAALSRTVETTAQQNGQNSVHNEKVALLEKQISEKDAVIASLESKYNLKSSECAKNLETAVSLKFNNLLKKVIELRQIRKSVPSGINIFPEELQAQVDLFLNNDDVIKLRTMKQYQNIVASEKNLAEQQLLITSCTEKDNLPDLIEDRDKVMKKLIRDIKNFLKHIALLPLDTRATELEDALNNLKMQYTDLISGEQQSFASDTKTESSLEIAINAYELIKSNQSSSIKALQKTANERSSKLFKILSEVQRECHCVIQDTNGSIESDIDILIKEYEEAMSEEIKSIQEIGQEGEDAISLKDVIRELKKSLDAEIADINLIRGTLVLQYSDIKEKYELLLQNKPDVNAVVQARKQIKALKSKFRHKLADITDMEEDSDENDKEELNELEEDLNEIRLKLHASFIEELEEMKILCDKCKVNFPELSIQHPEIGLDAFQASNYLLQNSRSIEHYSHNALPVIVQKKKQTTYKAMFNGRPCILKEITLDGKKLVLDDVLAHIVQFSKDRLADYDVDISCVFTNKNERKLYIHQDFMEDGNILEFITEKNPSEKVVCELLIDVLTALDKKESPYSALKPQNVLIKRLSTGAFRAVLAEPHFTDSQVKQLEGCLYLHKTIPGYPVLDMFQEQPSKQADMVCFGGMLLWVLNHNSSFSKNVHSDIELVVQDTLLKDLLRQLLNPTVAERITAGQALAHNYFKEILRKPEILSNSMLETVKEEEEVTDVESDIKEEESLVSEIDSHVESEKDDNSVDELNNNKVKTEAEEETETLQNEEESQMAIDGWNQALLEKAKRKSRLAAVLEQKPQDVSISDDDDDDF
ncbi:serine/threonine-protein kinase 31-like isoform X2 [Hydractinia symbiolongicarpus]|uniref:serine/threonine-protein kinase 31-like isoform X2 n=1 Tax=Hydractinia symbiolongicarpus TaxID=13093 RepID=UPI00254A4ED2|nr:serine/threonine-protein kinase 31-like isoform X2 [Hydractinia symbiolongicarpus]